MAKYQQHSEWTNDFSAVKAQRLTVLHVERTGAHYVHGSHSAVPNTEMNKRQVRGGEDSRDRQEVDRENRHSRVGFLRSRFVFLQEDSVAVGRGRFTRACEGEAGGRCGCNMVPRSHWLSYSGHT